MHLHHRVIDPWHDARLFHEDGGEGEGGGSGSEGGEAEGGEGEGGGNEPRSFTQAELDKIVQDRIARERKKYEGYDELKRKAAAYDEVEEAQRSELDKAIARAEKAEQAAADATARANSTLIDAAVVAEGAKLGARNPGLLRKLIDTEAVAIGDDGQVTGVTEALEALLAENPELVGKATPDPGAADQGARGGGVKQLSSEALKGMSPAEIRQARKEGRLQTLLTGGK
jgi:hypothetical protein